MVFSTGRRSSDRHWNPHRHWGWSGLPSASVLLRLSLRLLLSTPGLCSTGTCLCAASPDLRAGPTTGSGTPAILLHAVAVSFDIEFGSFDSGTTSSASDTASAASTAFFNLWPRSCSACGDWVVENPVTRRGPSNPRRDGPIDFRLAANSTIDYLTAVLSGQIAKQKSTGDEQPISDRRRIDDEHETTRLLDRGLRQDSRDCLVRFVSVPVHRLGAIWGTFGRSAQFREQGSVRCWLQV